MPVDSLTAAPGPASRTVRTADGRVLAVPDVWDLVPPGDPGLTRRVKAAGAAWTVQERRGRKVFSRGVWAPAAVVESIRRELAAERADPAYARRQATRPGGESVIRPSTSESSGRPSWRTWGSTRPTPPWPPGWPTW